MNKFLLFFLLEATTCQGLETFPTSVGGTSQSRLCTEGASDTLSRPNSIECGYPKKSPTVALFLSILPGGGQFYTENYLKGVVFGGTQLYFGGGTIYLHWQAGKAKDREDVWEYEWYSNQRNNFLWWDALIWALSMGDAYVSAHFYKFKEQGKLKIDTGYKILNSGNAFTLCLTKSF